MPEMKLIEFVNRVGSDEVAHNEQSHLNLHYLLSILQILNRM